MSNEEVIEDQAEENVNPAILWYVVHAYSGFEAYVKKVLESRIASSEHKQLLWTNYGPD